MQSIDKIREKTTREHSNSENEVQYSQNKKRWFSPDVTAAMFVYRTIEKTVFWEFDSVIMQNMSDNLLLFCTETWPSPRVVENHLYFVILASRKIALGQCIVRKALTEDSYTQIRNQKTIILKCMKVILLSVESVGFN